MIAARALAVVSLATLTPLATLSAACLGPDLTFAGPEGGGGDAGGAGEGGGATATTVGAGGGTTSTTTGAGGGCTSPDDCPDPGLPCVVPACADDTCGSAPSAIDEPCDLGGVDGVCNGQGSCVACTSDVQCSGTDTCALATGACVPRCSNGAVDGDETDVDCGGSCPANCAAGLTCTSGADCESNVCDTASTCASGTVVFVSAIDLRPDFGGALAGDALCQEYADAAGLSGTFMAWLSDSTTSPSVRFNQSAAPYRRVDGVVVAGNWAGLTSGVLQAPIVIDEVGGLNPAAEVWTATFPDGTALFDSCLEWTSQDIEPVGFAGLTSETNERWTIAYTQFCNRTGVRLYCFQQ